MNNNDEQVKGQQQLDLDDKKKPSKSATAKPKVVSAEPDINR